MLVLQYGNLQGGKARVKPNATKRNWSHKAKNDTFDGEEVHRERTKKRRVSTYPPEVIAVARAHGISEAAVLAELNRINGKTQSKLNHLKDFYHDKHSTSN